MILVTGGAGFIGSNLVKGLNKKGYEDIYIADDLTNGVKHKNMNRLSFKDYIDYRHLFNVLDRLEVKIVFHQGACADTTESNGAFMMDVNYEYSKTLWEYCNSKGIRFIYASSAAVYGSGENGFTEKSECEYPLNVYAFSKYQFDRYLSMNFSRGDSQSVGLRYFNVYGPQENHKGKMASVAYHLFNQIKAGESMKLFEGSETFLRDFIYVDDVVDVNLFFMENPEISGIFNCGTGKARSFMDIAGTLHSLYPLANLETIEFPNELKDKYQMFTQADTERLRKAGYSRYFTPLEEGVRMYAEILEDSGGYIV